MKDTLQIVAENANEGYRKAQSRVLYTALGIISITLILSRC